MGQVLISMSGGLDSTVLAWHAKKQQLVVNTISFDYGSKHNEIESKIVKQLLALYKESIYNGFHIDVRIPQYGQMETMDLLKIKSALMTNDTMIPEGHYEEESMRQTVVPGRNLLFIAYMAAVAESTGIEQIWIGAHKGDHYIYPDCREDFIQHANATVMASSDGKVRLYAPFIDMDKAEIVKLGNAQWVPFQRTRTCYSNNTVACGVCGSCQERLAAFKANGLYDPLEYKTREILPKKGE